MIHPSRTVLALCLMALSAGAQEPGQARDAVERLMAGGQGAQAAWDELVAGSDPAGQALKGLEGHPEDVGARRRLAMLLDETADASHLPRICELLGDADDSVRRILLGFLIRPDHGLAHLGQRVSVLEQRAREDPIEALRRRALLGLGEFDSELAIEALVDLTRSLPPPERALAAEALRPTPRARNAVRDLVRAGFEASPGLGRTPDDVLVQVLPLHGRLLADEVDGGESPRDRAPLVLGLRHPTREVRRAAERAFERLLSRLQDVGETDRAARLLGLLAQEGLDPRIVHYHQSRLALAAAGDPAGARTAARAMREAGGRPEYESLFERSLWAFRSLYLEGMAEFVQGEAASALPLFQQAGATLDVVLRERYDLEDDDESRLQHVDALHQRALAVLGELLVEMHEGASADRDQVGKALRAHRLSLEAQRGYVRVVGDSMATWDNLLEHDLSPLRLCFNLREFPGLSIPDGLALQERLGRVLASVAPREMPGFEPWTGLAMEVEDPLMDPRRRALLQDVVEEGLVQVEEELDRLRQRYIRHQIEQPGVLPDPRDELELQRVLRARARVMETLGRIEQEPEELLDQRIPSSMALWIGRDLRAEGRAADARRITELMRDHLEADGAHLRYFWGLQMVARIEMAIGSSYTDEGEPKQAEEQLLAAVERLEGIEERLAELGASRRQIAVIESMRSTALVSLAVNANVKLRDPERALEYYERAYELRQDDFMRVLLACYRARMDRDEEARALLREIHPHPDLYYNMACTYALLGDTQRALDFLEKELEENLASSAARERQRAWAADDPDLASLVGDPRFERLVGRN